MSEYLVGIDIGTSSCKIVVMDTGGNLVASTRRSYPTSHPRYGWTEQNPHHWYEALKLGWKELGERNPQIAQRVCAIGVTGQMMTLVIVDREGTVLRPAIVWSDQRCMPQVNYLKEHFGQLIGEITFNPVTNSYTLPKLLWLKENDPDTWKKMFKLQLPKDYIRYRLTGKWVTDLNDAASTLLLDVEKHGWSDEIAHAVGLEKEKLPEVFPCSYVVGHVSGNASSELGIKQGTPVVAGAGDLAAENLAAGVVDATRRLIRLGTSGSVSSAMSRPLWNPQILSTCYPHCIAGRWLIEVSDQSFGSCAEWFRRNFLSGKPKENTQADGCEYRSADRMAETVPPGAEGLLFHPFNNGGPYWNPYLRGAFYGITAMHEKRHFLRAILEGSAFCLKDTVMCLEDLIEQDAKEHLLIGGGSKSKVWATIICDVLRKNARILETADACVGASILSGLGISVFRTFEDALSVCTQKATKVSYNERNYRVYDSLYIFYENIHHALMQDSVTIHATVNKTKEKRGGERCPLQP